MRGRTDSWQPWALGTVRRRENRKTACSSWDQKPSPAPGLQLTCMGPCIPRHSGGQAQEMWSAAMTAEVAPINKTCYFAELYEAHSPVLFMWALRQNTGFCKGTAQVGHHSGHPGLATGSSREIEGQAGGGRGDKRAVSRSLTTQGHRT